MYCYKWSIQIASPLPASVPISPDRSRAEIPVIWSLKAGDCKNGPANGKSTDLNLNGSSYIRKGKWCPAPLYPPPPLWIKLRGRPWILKQGGLESFGPRLISINKKGSTVSWLFLYWPTKKNQFFLRKIVSLKDFLRLKIYDNVSSFFLLFLGGIYIFLPSKNIQLMSVSPTRSTTLSGKTSSNAQDKRKVIFRKSPEK